MPQSIQKCHDPTSRILRHSLPATPLTRHMLVFSPLTWRLAGLKLGLIGLALFSTASHALSLGGLAISSRTAPHFSASAPFSDNQPVRLSELRTRLATDAEYAQWGLQPPSEAHQLRIRVVPASPTAGYIELSSLTPLSQENFDLLVWASYAGQTLLTQYKVTLLDVPTLIKGKTVSESREPTFTPPTRSSASPAKPPVQRPAAPPVQAAPKEDLPPQPLAPAATPAPPPEVPVSPPLPQALAPTSATPAAQGDQTWTEDLQGTYGPAIACALVVFLFGFLVGRQARKAAPVRARAAPDPRHVALPRAPLPSPPQATASPPAPLSPSPAPATWATEPPLPVSTCAAQTDLAPAASGPVARMTPVTKASATALPTPGLTVPAQPSLPSDEGKSAGQAHIDLAKIYLSMGDPSTARMVLQEVIQEGSASEKSMAQQLIQQMA